MSRMLFAEPEDKPMRNVTVLRKIDPKMLGMMGVRFFITDTKSDQPARLSQRIKSGTNESLMLYEIDKVNIGQFSPTTPLLAMSIDDAIRKIRSIDFDPEESIVTHSPLKTTIPLSRTRNASLKFEGLSVRFRALSDGISIALLPLEYSHCLDVQNLVGERANIFRANILLTGIMFEKEVDVRLLARTGPVSNSGCLLADREDLLSYGIKKSVEFFK